MSDLYLYRNIEVRLTGRKAVKRTSSWSDGVDYYEITSLEPCLGTTWALLDELMLIENEHTRSENNFRPG